MMLYSAAYLLFFLQVYIDLVRRRRTEFGEAEQGDEYKLKHVKLLGDVKKNLKMVSCPDMQCSSNTALSLFPTLHMLCCSADLGLRMCRHSNTKPAPSINPSFIFFYLKHCM